MEEEKMPVLRLLWGGTYLPLEKRMMREREESCRPKKLDCLTNPENSNVRITKFLPALAPYLSRKSTAAAACSYHLKAHVVIL